MDQVTYLFFILFLTIIALSYFLFFRELNNRLDFIKTKYKWSVILICIASNIIIVLIYFSFEFYFVKEFLKFKLDNNFVERIIKTLIIFALNGISNFYILKLYLKRISKTKNEIELIGKE
ncbi:hypothetical protein FLA105535_02176 [Flavobacterium bizetiae]|nr:hypothetical protein FLA105535_02176 [Flavobacterium bizetiae]